jgi:hypothetical protein
MQAAHLFVEVPFVGDELAARTPALIGESRYRMPNGSRWPFLTRTSARIITRHMSEDYGQKSGSQSKTDEPASN